VAAVMRASLPSTLTPRLLLPTALVDAKPVTMTDAPESMALVPWAPEMTSTPLLVLVLAAMLLEIPVTVMAPPAVMAVALLMSTTPLLSLMLPAPPMPVTSKVPVPEVTRTPAVSSTATPRLKVVPEPPMPVTVMLPPALRTVELVSIWTPSLLVPVALLAPVPRMVMFLAATASTKLSVPMYTPSFLSVAPVALANGAVPMMVMSPLVALLSTSK
jgi:hypothetical protein